jgi:hypothetical protein
LLLEATAELLVIFRSALAPTAENENIPEFMLRFEIIWAVNIQRKYNISEFLHITMPNIQHTSYTNLFEIKIRLLPP